MVNSIGQALLAEQDVLQGLDVRLGETEALPGLALVAPRVTGLSPHGRITHRHRTLALPPQPSPHGQRMLRTMPSRMSFSETITSGHWYRASHHFEDERPAEDHVRPAGNHADEPASLRRGQRGQPVAQADHLRQADGGVVQPVYVVLRHLQLQRGQRGDRAGQADQPAPCRRDRGARASSARPRSAHRQWQCRVATTCSGVGGSLVRSRSVRRTHPSCSDTDDTEPARPSVISVEPPPMSTTRVSPSNGLRSALAPR